MKCPCETRPRGLAATAIAAILTLSACGGGDGPSTDGGEGAASPVPAPAPMPPSPPPSSACQALARRDSRSVPFRRRPRRDRPGLRGARDRLSMTLKPDPVAGRSRPAPGAGETRRVGTAAPVRRRWSVSSAPSRRQQERDGRDDLVFIDFGAPKTLRIDSAALASERRAVLAALRNINSSLPWEHRILLGPDISGRVATEDVPDDEIHIHFTDGKALWPESDGGDYEPNVLGIGGSNFDREAYRALGGVHLHRPGGRRPRRRADGVRRHPRGFCMPGEWEPMSIRMRILTPFLCPPCRATWTKCPVSG